MASTRCKFTCHSIIDGYGDSKVVNLSAVYSPDDPESENGQFWTATPSGQISLQINNPDGYAVFEQGKAYYVDLTPAADWTPEDGDSWISDKGPMPETIVGSIDARCDCDRCEGRTQETYTMTGSCSNCGSGPFTILYRSGDRVADQDCPTCGKYNSVRSGGQRLAA